MSTIKELSKEHNIPKDWLWYRMTITKLSLDEAKHAFENPTLEQCLGGEIVDKPLRRSEILAHVKNSYSLELTELVQYWADCGYRRTPIAKWLGITPTQLAGFLTRVGYRVKWADNPNLDRRGKPIQYMCKGKPTTITEFANKYNFHLGTLTGKWHRLSPGEVSKKMDEIAYKEEKSKVRSFLTMKLV